MWKILTPKTFLLISIGSIATIILGSKMLVTQNNSNDNLATKKPIITPMLATASGSSSENSRTSFLLAADLIDRQQGKAALAQLQGLEQNYPLLAPYILLSKGKAYQLENQLSEAEKVWQKLASNYANSPASAEALYLLGKTNPAYWQQAIIKFPSHPRTHEIIRQKLSQNPNQPNLMAVLVKYTPDDSGVDKMRDRLVKEYSSQLTPETWEAIADSYWVKWDYGPAGKAYAKAPRTSGNLYRAGRGYHIANSKATAKQFYLQLLAEYPDAPDTGWGLRRLATIVNKKEGLAYLDLAIQKFPHHAPEALLEKATLLDGLGSPRSAAQARQTVLTDYKNSESAAQYRWNMASKKAKAGDLVSAWQWAQPIVINNPDSKIAPKAGFWIAKWATKLNRPEDATQAYQLVLARFPRSYYAWRSAVALGWDVGDFTTVRYKTPEVVKIERIFPPGGSETFQELYKLGLEEEAWAQFQTEISDKPQSTNLTVADEFTQGLFKLYQGKNLRGINQIWYLEDRDTPEDKQQWQQLRQTPEYWQALYPFPFENTILKWSKQRGLNPLLVTALIRQESRFEPEIESSAGALGLMQVIPPTAKTAAKNIGLSNYSLTKPEDNVNIGTYYLDFTHKKYNNNSMLAVASYNAGPNAVAKWVSRYGLKDVDEFVEKIPYRETKGYVESVFENYWNYMLVYNPEIGKQFKDLASDNVSVN
ncbi:transglycosylase SLT domain-containing protein [Waterburya agarophytonicola K14]|uniref:Transglycosylase SLT domain-containing protein n=1 Tax=Waterburya agarophytonicola KI4 TaxID=2874699 RepID=A0A964BNM2_9CYAN|nr:transglycosylase SLT domain-containing protein [Waterburya agarophytonicola]MCC0176748.1 transglycosylase SLT domain-containing protein [Waterburya agarophytonicola KI4]